MEHGALEEPASGRVAGGLVERDHVGAVVGEHCRHARNDAGPIGALRDEPPVVLGDDGSGYERSSLVDVGVG